MKKNKVELVNAKMTVLKYVQLTLTKIPRTELVSIAMKVVKLVMVLMKIIV